MFIKQDLAWLDGFPISQGGSSSGGWVEWQLRPRVGRDPALQIRIDREYLIRSEFTFRKLVHRFPQALPKVVRNVAQWTQRVTRLLDAVKSAVHDGVPLFNTRELPMSGLRPVEQRQVVQLITDWPQLEPVVDWLLWSTFVVNDDRDFLFNWLSENGEWLSNWRLASPGIVTVRRILVVADLVQTDGAECLPLLRSILGEPAAFTLPIVDLTKYAANTATALRLHWDVTWDVPSLPKLPKRPTQCFARLFEECLDWIEPKPTHVRRRLWALLNETLVTDRIPERAAIWDDFDGHVRQRMRQIREVLQAGWAVEFNVKRKELATKVESRAHELGAGMCPKTLLAAAQDLAEDDNRGLADRVLRCLRLLPPLNASIPLDTSGTTRCPVELLRGSLLWSLTMGVDDGSERLCLAFLPEFERYLRATQGDPQALALWVIDLRIDRLLTNADLRSSDGPLRNGLHGLIPDDDPKQWRPFIEVLLQTRRELLANRELLWHLRELLSETNDAELTVRCVKRLHEFNLGHITDRYVLAIAARLATAIVPFQTLAKTLHDHCEPLEIKQRDVEFIVRMQADFVAAGWSDVLPKLIVRREARRVINTARLLKPLKSVEGKLIRDRKGLVGLKTTTDDTRVRRSGSAAFGFRVTQQRLNHRDEQGGVAADVDPKFKQRRLFLAAPYKPCSSDLQALVRLSYPSELIPQIELLLSLPHQSLRNVDRVIGQWVPSLQKIEAEIAVIEEKLLQQPDNVNLQRRLESLLSRWCLPPMLSPQRLVKLQEKLTTAAENSVMRHFEWTTKYVLVTAFASQVSDGIELAQHEIAQAEAFLDGLLATKAGMSLLCGISELKEPYRSMGRRLLYNAWGGRPWDHAAEPANVAFIRKMRALGLRIEEWLDSNRLFVAPSSAVPVVVSPFVVPPSNGAEECVSSQEGGRDGIATYENSRDGIASYKVRDSRRRTLTLAFETNPLEVLLMGYHFETCLSPNEFNFFSAVVNAVDINKRVLYARDAQGKVVGRCLFALSDEGTLVTFRPYGETQSFNFAEHVGRIAERLAKRLGTVVVLSSKVSPLLTPDWYDDGAVDCGVQIDGHKSTLKEVIKTVPASDVVALMETSFGESLPMTTRLSLLLSLDETKERVDLLPVLRPLLFQHESSLSLRTVMRLTEWADVTADAELASRLAERHLPDWLLGRSCLCCEPQYSYFRLLLKYRPSTALRVLRQTRPRGIHSDTEDNEDTRREFLAEAHAALGRTKLAATLRNRQ